MEVMWVDKHKPESLDEVVGHDYAVESLKEMVDQGLYDHLILSGPPGTGKTTILELLAKEILKDTFKHNHFMFNSSDERGIDVVREDITDKASQSPMGADWKIIIMDEVDGMTSEAQQALRGTIEEYQDNCLFFMTANFSNKVIDAVGGSRVTERKIGPVDRDSMRERLEYILDQEGQNLPDDLMEALLDYGESRNGDLRSTIKRLQIAVIDYKYAEVDKERIKEELKYFSSSKMPINKMIKFASKGNFTKVDKMIRRLIVSGASHGEIFEEVSNYVLIADDISDHVKANVLEACARGSDACNRGARPRTQLNYLMVNFADSGRKGKRDVFDDSQRIDKDQIKKNVSGKLKSMNGGNSDKKNDKKNSSASSGDDNTVTNLKL